MPSRYAAEGSVAITGDTILGIIGSATIRCAVYYVSLGCEAAPDDITVIASVKGTDGNAAGTSAGAPPTPDPLDADDRIAICTTGHGYTVEPTNYGGPLLHITMNQRSHYQFYAQEGGEFIVTSAANALIGAILDTMATPTSMSCVMHWKE